MVMGQQMPAEHRMRVAPCLVNEESGFAQAFLSTDTHGPATLQIHTSADPCSCGSIGCCICILQTCIETHGSRSAYISAWLTCKDLDSCF